MPGPVEFNLLKPFCVELLQALRKERLLSLGGLSINSAKALFVKELLPLAQRPILWLADDESNLNQIKSDLAAWQIDPYLILDEKLLSAPYSLEVAQALSLVAEKQASVIVGTPETLRALEVAHPKELTEQILTVKMEERLDLVNFFNTLIERGYQVSPGVLTAPGTYTKRGGIIDVFPVNTHHPVRIELEDDCVINIYEFNFFTNAKLSEFATLKIYPIQVEKVGQNFFKYFKDSLVLLESATTLTAKTL